MHHPSPPPARWIWQRPDWPDLTGDEARLHAPLGLVAERHRALLARAARHERDRAAEADTLTWSLAASYAIEGEELDIDAVRSSIARQLGVDAPPHKRETQRHATLAALVIEATTANPAPITEQLLLSWHRRLLDDTDTSSPGVVPGTYRVGSDPMQVISGGRVGGRTTVWFEAPPASAVPREMQLLVDWLDASRDGGLVNPWHRASIAHLWLLTIHPFGDGNGRVSRLLTDRMLSEHDPDHALRYSLSSWMLEHRKEYYDRLTAAQDARAQVTEWHEFFLRTLSDSIDAAIDRWRRDECRVAVRASPDSATLKPEQTKLLERLLSHRADNFAGGIAASQYATFARVDKATATRHLTELTDRGLVARIGSGRAVRYRLVLPD